MIVNSPLPDSGCLAGSHGEEDDGGGEEDKGEGGVRGEAEEEPRHCDWSHFGLFTIFRVFSYTPLDIKNFL